MGDRLVWLSAVWQEKPASHQTGRGLIEVPTAAKPDYLLCPVPARCPAAAPGTLRTAQHSLSLCFISFLQTFNKTASQTIKVLTLNNSHIIVSLYIQSDSSSCFMFPHLTQIISFSSTCWPRFLRVNQSNVTVLTSNAIPGSSLLQNI